MPVRGDPPAPAHAQCSTFQWGREPHRKLPHDRMLVKRLASRDRAEALPGLGRPPGHELAELDNSLPAEPGQVDHSCKRVERLARADVRGRLFPADVLLACLQREYEAAPPIDVSRLTRDPPGHAA